MIIRTDPVILQRHYQLSFINYHLDKRMTMSLSPSCESLHAIVVEVRFSKGK